MEFANPNYNKDVMQTLKRWLEDKNEGKSFAEYFRECGCSSIGIMDAGEIGRILYGELKNTGITVKWFVDQNAEGIDNIDGIQVRMMKDVFELESVDIICISPIYDYEALSSFLIRNDPRIRTISMKDATYEM